MLNFLEKIPNPAKALLLVAFVSIGIGMFGKDFIDNKSVLSPSQSEQKNKDTAEEITVRLQIRNEKTKVAIPDVTVEFDRLGVPTPVGYTDSAGYIDIKIPKTEYVKIYLSKAGLQGKNFQIPISSELIKNIPTNASINFTEIPSQINKIAVLQISFSGQEPSKPFKIQYNNIPVSK